MVAKFKMLLAATSVAVSLSACPKNNTESETTTIESVLKTENPLEVTIYPVNGNDLYSPNPVIKVWGYSVRSQRGTNFGIGYDSLPELVENLKESLSTLQQPTGMILHTFGLGSDHVDAIVKGMEVAKVAYDGREQKINGYF
ncbi:MAG TPA: hypothetical protein VJC39_02630 [Candidatus Nanoarchaeia archaeon]|nr:hypothetical protein [Candidatus Nanoarchaeia archaeon]